MRDKPSFFEMLFVSVVGSALAIGVQSCSTSVNAQGDMTPSLIRNQSNCRDSNYHLKDSDNRVRFTYVDGQTKNSITYTFTCSSDGLLVNPLEESRSIAP